MNDYLFDILPDLIDLLGFFFRYLVYSQLHLENLLLLFEDYLFDSLFVLAGEYEPSCPLLELGVSRSTEYLLLVMGTKSAPRAEVTLLFGVCCLSTVRDLRSD